MPGRNQMKKLHSLQGLVVMQREATNVNYTLPNYYVIVNSTFSCRTNYRLSLVSCEWSVVSGQL